MFAPEMQLHENDGRHLTRNQMEIAGLVVYAVVLAVGYTMAAVLMLLGSGGTRPS
ncbi:MAG TPA: hypothetical protein VGL22_18055 [Terracidiphilus sp.]|jgi:hypothetical protein